MLIHHEYELLDQAECINLLGFSHVGRIALSIGALPAIYPVNYMVDGESIVFCTCTGADLSNATDKAVLAFEAGHIDPTGRGGWSVLAVGVAGEIADPETRLKLAFAEHAPWLPSDSARLFRLPLELVSGTRFTLRDEHTA